MSSWTSRMMRAASALLVVAAVLYAVEACVTAPPESKMAPDSGIRLAYADDQVWSNTDVVTPLVSAPGDAFGYAVALQGDTLLGAAPGRKGNLGGANVFRHSDAGVWNEEATLEPPPDAGSPLFPMAPLRAGQLVDLDGDRAILGTEYAALIYVRTGTTWALEQNLRPPCVNATGFGVAVALHGDVAAVLVYNEVGVVEPDGGAIANNAALEEQPAVVFMYERGATAWTLQSQITPPPVVNIYDRGRVRLEQDRLAVALAGEIAIYQRSPSGVWILDTTLVSPKSEDQASSFGFEMAVKGDTILTGDGASVFVFDHSASGWQNDQTLVDPTGFDGDSCFGCALDFDGDIAFIANPRKQELLRYTLSSDAWTAASITPFRLVAMAPPTPNGTASPTVAVSGSLAAFGDPTSGSGAGSITTAGLESALGDACTTNAGCASRFCVDGVCCDTACGGGSPNDCMTCARADRPGSCAPALAPTVCRPSAGECDEPETCDGVGLSCPADLLRVNGSLCTGGACVDGTCSALPSLDGGDDAAPSPAVVPVESGGGCSASPAGATDRGPMLLLSALIIAAIAARRCRATRALVPIMAVTFVTVNTQRSEPELVLTSGDGDLLARFEAGGVRFTDQSDSASWSMALREFGRRSPSSGESVIEASAVRHGARIEFQRGDLIEWYEAKASSIEQGFDIARRPVGTDPLVLRLGVSDSSSFGYGKLAVVDALGVQVNARVNASAGGIEIEIDDAVATYPIVVDPEVWREHQHLLPRVGVIGPAASADGPILAVTQWQQLPYAIDIFRQTGTTWARETDLVPFRGVYPFEVFGTNISVSGNTVVAGTPHSSRDDVYAGGSVFVFDYDGASWHQTTELLYPDDPGCVIEFGEDVALEGDTLVIGADNYNRFDDDCNGDNSLDPTQPVGAAYVYQRASGVWTEEAKVLGPPSAKYFGENVALSGDTMLVRSDGALVSAFSFDRVGTTWQPSGSIEDPYEGEDLVDQQSNVRYALLGNTAAFFGKTLHVWTRTGNTWSVSSRLTVADPDHQNFAGGALRAGRIIAPSPQANGGKGAVYIFDQDATGTWNQTARLVASDGQVDDFFGGFAVMPSDNELFAYASRPASGVLYDFRLEPDAVPCTADTAAAACAAGRTCVDGFCCDTACGGNDPNDCQACSVAAGAQADGVCSPVAPRVCRPARDACDVADLCDGVNGDCPADTVAVNGVACTGGVCTDGRCSVTTSVATENPTPPAPPVPASPGDCGCHATPVNDGTPSRAAIVVALFAIALRRRRQRVGVS